MAKRTRAVAAVAQGMATALLAAIESTTGSGSCEARSLGKPPSLAAPGELTDDDGAARDEAALAPRRAHSAATGSAPDCLRDLSGSGVVGSRLGQCMDTALGAATVMKETTGRSSADRHLAIVSRFAGEGFSGHEGAGR